MTEALEYVAAIRDSALRAHVSGRQLAQLAVTDGLQDGRQDVLVLLDRPGGAAVESFLQPGLGRLPYGVGGISGPRGDPLVQILMKPLQLVEESGLRCGDDLLLHALAVRVVAQADLGPPPARTGPVSLRICTRPPVIERDRVLASPAPCGHG